MNKTVRIQFHWIFSTTISTFNNYDFVNWRYDRPKNIWHWYSGLNIRSCWSMLYFLLLLFMSWFCLKGCVIETARDSIAWMNSSTSRLILSVVKWFYKSSFRCNFSSIYISQTLQSRNKFHHGSLYVVRQFFLHMICKILPEYSHFQTVWFSDSLSPNECK